MTSVVRRATLRETSGWLRVIDLAERRVEASLPVAESRRRQADPNPRGGLRGARGLSAHGDRLVVANTDSLFVLDRSWQVVERITHPWLGDVHAILAESDGIWVTCTSADLLLKLGWQGELLHSWSWRADAAVRRELGIGRAVGAFDAHRDYRDPLTTGGSFNVAHLNAVTRGPEGLIVGLGRLLSPRAIRRQQVEGALVRLAEAMSPGRAALRGVRRRREGRYPGRPRGERRLPDSSYALVALADVGVPTPRSWADARIVLRRRGIRVPNHDVLLDQDRLLYADSNHNRLVAVDRRTGREAVAVEIPGDPAFARGLAHLGGDRFLVGSRSPAAVHTVDLEAEAIVDSITLSDDGRDSVFAIALLPEGFDAFPANVAGLSEPLA